MKAILILLLVLLAGCADGTQDSSGDLVADKNGAQSSINIVDTDSNQTITESHPVMIRANDQTHLITIIGSESGLQWNNATATFSSESDLSCHQDMPTQGNIKPGQVIHITADLSTFCSITIYYNELKAGTWDFTFEEQQ